MNFKYIFMTQKKTCNISYFKANKCFQTGREGQGTNNEEIEQ